MLAEVLFPQEASLEVEKVEAEEARVVIVVFTQTRQAACPACSRESDRRHSCYYRYPADLPLMGRPVQLQLRVQRFFCDNKSCPKQTFAEEVSTLVKRYGRRTERLSRSLEQVAFESGGESGARILAAVGIHTTPDSLLRQVRQAPEEAVQTPRVLGIDDWAKKKGHSYGTILIDLETHRVVDVLPERSAEAVEQWLKQHPGVEVISRDRWKEYAKGATLGAPDAVQTADRWHLMENLRKAVERLLEGKPACLKAAAQEPDVTPTLSATPLDPAEVEEIEPAPAGTSEVTKAERGSEPKPPTKAQRRQRARHARKQERFDLVRALHQQGLSQREISRQTKIARRTIQRYLTAEHCPFYPVGIQRGASKLDRFRGYLEKRWQDGCHNGTQLWRECRQLGFDGSRGMVAKWAAEARRSLPTGQSKEKAITPLPAPPKKVVPWSPRRTSWLLFRPEAELDEEEKQALQRVKQADPAVAQAHHLVHAFQQMVRQREADKLAPWLDQVEASGIDPLISFAKGIRQDFDAVKNALTLPWSNERVAYCTSSTP